MSGKTVPKTGNPIDSVSVSCADIEAMALITAVYAAVEASEILMTVEGRQKLEILNFKIPKLANLPFGANCTSRQGTVLPNQHVWRSSRVT
jgi:hypothetical protein